MSRSKPCLGYPTRTDAVIALRSEGLTAGEIAMQIGIPTNAVTALAASGERRKKRPVEQFGRTVVVSRDLLDALRPHAERRDVSVNELVRRIVGAIVDDDMVDAVLDDRGGDGDA